MGKQSKYNDVAEAIELSGLAGAATKDVTATGESSQILADAINGVNAEPDAGGEQSEIITADEVSFIVSDLAARAKVGKEYDDNQDELSPVSATIQVATALKQGKLADGKWCPIKFIPKDVSEIEISVPYNYIVNYKDGIESERVNVSDLDIADIEGEKFTVVPEWTDESAKYLDDATKYTTADGFSAAYKVGVEVPLSEVRTQDNFTGTDILRTGTHLKQVFLTISNDDGSVVEVVPVDMSLFALNNTFYPTKEGNANIESLQNCSVKVILNKNTQVLIDSESVGNGKLKTTALLANVPTGTSYVGTIELDGTATLKNPVLRIKSANFELDKAVVSGVDAEIPADAGILDIKFSVDSYTHDSLLTNTNHRTNSSYQLEDTEDYTLRTEPRPSLNKEFPSNPGDRKDFDTTSAIVSSTTYILQQRMNRLFIDSLPAQFAKLEAAKEANLKLNMVNSVNFRTTVLSDSHDMSSFIMQETVGTIANRKMGLRLKIEKMAKDMVRNSGWEGVLTQRGIKSYEILVMCNQDIDLDSFVTEAGINVVVTSSAVVGAPRDGTDPRGDVWVSLRAINGPKTVQGIEVFSPAVMIAKPISIYKGKQKEGTPEVDFITGEPTYEVNHLLPILGKISVTNYK